MRVSIRPIEDGFVVDIDGTCSTFDSINSCRIYLRNLVKQTQTAIDSAIETAEEFEAHYQNVLDKKEVTP